MGTLGPYRLIKELGHGGMGAVYAAIDTRLERQLALKVMLPKYVADASAKERFLREARAAAKITHDHVVTVYEADERQGVPYIAMQFLKGCPLDDYLKKQGDLKLKQILRIGCETALGLAAAHALGLIHRDIKPGNIWLEAPTGRVKLLDFGLAKPVHGEVELTQSGAIVGTPAYMSPEQARSAKVDHRSDIFSLGAMLYRLCTGRLPFHGENTMAVLMALASDTPQPIRELNPQVPQSLADLIHQMLAKNVADRPASAKEVAERLRAIAKAGSNPATAGPQSASVAQPLPRYVPMAISVGYEVNPFAGLGDDATEHVERSAQPKEAAARKRPKALWLVGLLFAAFAVLVAGGVIIIIRNKDGTETKIEVPDGASVTIKDKSGKTIAQVPPEKQPPATTDPDRQAAEWVLSIGGVVRVNGQDRDIKAAADLPGGPFRLTLVDCGNNPKVSDAGLAHFKDCKGLTQLSLHNTPVSDAGLAHFKDCKGLTFLHLSSTPVSDAGLAHFKDCKGLTLLKLHKTQVSDAGLAHFKDCKGLTHVDLGVTQVSDAGLANFKNCKDLRVLWLTNTQVSDAGLAHFKDCKGLTAIYLHNTQVGDAGLAHFKDCKGLTTLNLGVTPVSDAGLANFKDCKGLTNLHLYNTPVSDAGLAHFKDCKDLTHLSLSGTQGSDAGLAHFKDCKGLTFLWLNGTQVSDAGLAHFKDCKGLTNLNLNNTRVGDAGLAHLKDCKGLTVLHLDGTPVSDAGLAHLKDCKGLTDLRLAGTQVGDAGLTHFKDCKGLTGLYLNGTKVSDAGLAHFKDCKGLTVLDVRKTKVTAKALAEFHAAVPKCKIEHDGGTIEPKASSKPDR